MAQNFIYKPNCSITEFNHRTQRLQLQQQIQKQILKPRTYFNTDRSNIVSNDKLQEHIAAELHADDDMSAVYHCGQLTSVFDSIKWSPLGNNQTNDSNIKNTSNTSILSIKHCAHTTVYLDIPRPPSIPTASLIRNTPPSLLLSRLSPNYYSTCCSLTYNMFAAYAEAVTLQMKCKTHFNRLLHVGGHLDMRSLRYLILMVLVYWSVLTHVAVATNVTTTTAQPFLLPLLPSLTSHNDSFVQQSLTAFDSQHVSSLRNFTFTLTVSGTMSTSLSNQTSKSLITYDASMNNFAFNLRSLTRRDAANVPDPDAEDDDSSYHDEEFDEYEALIHNKSAKGKYIGAPCNNMKCETSLVHVTCEKETLTCGCEKNYPVQLGLTRGCDKPKKLGEQCFYDETCQYNDENSLCVQVRHNALCQCASGFHSVSYTKPTRRVFCTQDLDELNSDLPTLLGVCLGIGVLAGLICMVLHLFSKTKYPRHRNFGDANLPPPIMYSSETGILSTVQSGRPSSRSSIRSSGGSVGSYGNRRTSSVGGTTGTGASKGILVSTSRTGSRRPSLASVHSTSSSVRSYSMMRFEKEQQQKEIRQEMKLRLARLQQQQHQQQHQQQLSQHKPQIIIGDTLMMQHGATLSRITMATPSPLTPNSMDELLPSVDETQEYPPKTETKCTTETVVSATLTALKTAASSSPKVNNQTNIAVTDIANAAAYIGPCNSSNEAL